MFFLFFIISDFVLLLNRFCIFLHIYFYVRVSILLTSFNFLVVFPGQLSGILQLLTYVRRPSGIGTFYLPVTRLLLEFFIVDSNIFQHFTFCYQAVTMVLSIVFTFSLKCLQVLYAPCRGLQPERPWSQSLSFCP